MKPKPSAAVVGLCLILALHESGSAQRGLSAHVLVGLCGVEQNLGPPVRGEPTVTVDGHGPEWRARIGAYDVPVDRKDGAVSFSLPGDARALRTHLSAVANSIEGHWIQPASVVYSNRYARPVVLAKDEKDVWRGQVVPLDE